MELTPQQIQDKIVSLRAELETFANAEQNEINQMQTNYRNRLRAAQKYADMLEGKIAAYQEMLPKDQPDTPVDTYTTMSNTRPAPPLTPMPVAQEVAE